MTLKLDKPSYQPGDTIQLHIAAPAAGKGCAMIESSEGPLWWKEIDVPANGLDLSIPVDKARNATTSISARWWFAPGDNPNPPRRSGRLACCICRWGDENRCLNIALDNLQKMRPNQTLSVKVKASVKEGPVLQKVNAGLPAVDSGVPNITDYVTPDPWQAFLVRSAAARISTISTAVIEGQGRNGRAAFWW
ncbi:hypothetical protein KIF59_13790 [Enterobacter cloacae subsp. cloacae]|nr:hypothetical protein [Enterobacter cloacae subsp. cloacae]